MNKFLLILALVSVCLSVKPDLNTKTAKSNTKSNKVAKTICEVAEACRVCTFEELNFSEAECQKTGAKQIKKCAKWSESALLSETYEDEICEYPKTNSMYLFLFIAVNCALLSYFYRKNYRKKLLDKTFDKLSSTKDR